MRFSKKFPPIHKPSSGKDSRNGMLIWGFKRYPERVEWITIILESVIE